MRRGTSQSTAIAGAVLALLPLATGCSDVGSSVGRAWPGGGPVTPPDRQVVAFGSVTTVSVATGASPAGDVGSTGSSGAILPAPAVPSTTRPSPARPSVQSDTEAVTAALRSLLDPTVPFASKEAYLQEPAALRAAHDAFAELIPLLGPLRVEVAAVEVAGDRAVITFDVVVADEVVQAEVHGEAARRNGTWRFTTATFCDAIAASPVICP